MRLSYLDIQRMSHLVLSWYLIFVSVCALAATEQRQMMFESCCITGIVQRVLHGVGDAPGLSRLPKDTPCPPQEFG
jgi:uncharacterized protein YybS (DUF2232 family)